MDKGRTLFAQLMDFLPWSTFTRLVVRYDGDHRVRSLNCAEQYRAMVFGQLIYRESLRDIETCLPAQTAKLYRIGFRWPVRRSTSSRSDALHLSARSMKPITLDFLDGASSDVAIRSRIGGFSEHAQDRTSAGLGMFHTASFSPHSAAAAGT
jgi:Domain of unknown function (DUF4372)